MQYSYEVFFSNNIRDTAKYLQSTLLSHEHLVESTSYIKGAIDFLRQNQSGLPLALGEIGSGLAGSDKNKTQVAEIESSLGTAVWTVDFHMYMMAIVSYIISTSHVYFKSLPLLGRSIDQQSTRNAMEFCALDSERH